MQRYVLFQPWLHVLQLFFFFLRNDEVHFVLDQPAYLFSASSLKWKSEVRHVAPLGHIILTQSQPVITLSHWSCVLSGESTNTNVIVFGLTRPGLEPTIYHTRGEHSNRYATDTFVKKPTLIINLIKVIHT